MLKSISINKRRWLALDLDRYFAHLNRFFFAFLLGLLFFADASLFIVCYLSLFIFISLRTLLTPGDPRTKRYLIISYFVIVILQIVMVNSILISSPPIPTNRPGHLIRNFFAVAAFIFPIIVSRYVTAGKYAHFYLPSLSEATTIGISNVAGASSMLKTMVYNANGTRKKLNKDNLKAVAEEITRNDSFRYINNGTLTEGYFKKASESLDDPHLYLVISRTGSPASEIISVFTRQQYNHASLSFDSNLETTISYNGGEKVYPPGLNMEMIEFFSKSPDASILVYSLECPIARKRALLEKIARINEEGSAYNMMGLVLHRSYKPNIMFCSQFVYKMLESVDLAYFMKPGGKVSPTDLIELDYYKKLTFVREIKL